MKTSVYRKKLKNGYAVTRLWFNLFLALLFSTVFLCDGSIVLPTRRVVIDKTSAHNSLWLLESAQGFDITDAHNAAKKKQVSDSLVHVALDSGTLIINGQSAKSDKVVISPINGIIHCGGQEYTGTIVIAGQDGAISIINYAPSEEQENPDKTSPHENSQKHPAVKKTKQQEPSKKESVHVHASYNVRVLLDEKSNLANPWVLKNDGFVIVDPADQKEQMVIYGPTLSITQEKGQWHFNGQKFLKKQAYIIPNSGNITFEGNHYQGGFLVTSHKGKLLLINNLEIEEYVTGVLRSEGWPGWPLEINKVMAVACRTYVIAMVQQSKLKKLPYHIKNTNAHQTYCGAHNDEVLKLAVEQTKGLFLAYKGKPITAMFDSCCGGIIPAKIKGFDFNKAPYLKRTYACPHCKGCKIYHWQAHFTLTKLANILHAEFPQLKKIKSIKITKKDDAGIVHEVAIQGLKRTVLISGKKLYSLLQPKVKSRTFSLATKGDAITFKGRGYGHQLGLCQWGAREMVRKGYGFKDILSYYYPKTNFMRLS
ncbi:MAG TPA: SpoIID/LytB domain-containing protein [Candidatus Babeliales bacterium]|nr:SpoIID/LytB domain-containing protein [Candidatus Babeliales bacterium]